MSDTTVEALDVLEVIPYGNYLLIKTEEVETRTAGGLYIPEQAKDKPTVGKVLAVGTGLKMSTNGDTIPCLSEVGDRILFNKHGSQDIKVKNGVTLTLVAEGDVYCKLRAKQDRESPQ